MTETMTELGAAALALVNAGFGVIPLVEREKRPATDRGLKDWTDNPKTVMDWWGKSQNANDNIGIVCGEASDGVFVIDLDVKDGLDGNEALREFEIANGRLPETVSAVTGSGGMHYYFRAPKGVRVKTSANHELGVDIRGEGGYVVAPPSVHPNGNRYEWENPPDEMDVAEADGKVLAFIRLVQAGGADGVGAFGKPFELPATITQPGRNDTLFRYAAHLRGSGMGKSEIEALVKKANTERCSPTLPLREIRTIVDSACKYEPGHSKEFDAAHPTGPGEGDEADADLGTPGKTKGRRAKVDHYELAMRLLNEDHACLIGGAPAVWTGTRWDMGTDAIARRCLFHEPKATTGIINEVHNHIIYTAPHRDVRRDFDPEPYVQFKNGTFTALGKEVEPESHMFIMATIPCELDLDAECRDVDRFLDSVSNGDEDTRRLMMQVVAACICSMRIVDQAAVLMGCVDSAGGEASNGKSTYINMLRALLGPENVSSLGLKTLGQRFQAGHLVGRLANIGDDIPSGFINSDELSIFKQVVTGDEVYADVKGGKGFSFTPMATQIYSANEFPRLGDNSEGIYRRLAIVPFRRTFRPSDPDFDPRIIEKLTTPEALRHLAALAMEELAELAETRRFMVVDDVSEAMREIRTANDSVLRWIVEEGISADYFYNGGRGVVTTDVYDDYKEWAVRNGTTHWTTLTTLSRRLKAIFAENGFSVEVRKQAGKSIRRYKCRPEGSSED